VVDQVAQQRLRAAEAPVVTIADDLQAARWVVRLADWDPRVYAAVSEW
jgi:TatD DNase family protein